MRRLIFSLVTIICLIGLIYSFKVVVLSPLKQESSHLTGSPVWNGGIGNYDQQILISGTLVPLILIFLSMIISIIFAHKEPLSKVYVSYFIFPDYPTSIKNNPSNIKTRSFNKVLAYYTSFIFITSLTFYILEPGKLWATFNSLDNLIGLIIIFFLTLEGQIHGNKFLVFSICSSYIVLINLLITALKWPLDYLVFKVQNLAIDFALLILFSRLYLHTHYYMKDQKPLLLTHNQPEAEADQDEITANNKLEFINHPNQVFLLPLAAFVHVFGSAISYVLVDNIVGRDIVFLLSIAIASSMYSFYIYLDTHYTTLNLKSKNLILPYTPLWKLLLVFSWSIILSAAIIRIIILKKGV